MSSPVSTLKSGAPRVGLARRTLGDLRTLGDQQAIRRYLGRARLERERRSSGTAPPVIVLQNGKVGSISIVRAIERAGRCHVAHVHHLNERSAEWMQETVVRGVPFYGWGERGRQLLEWAADRLPQIRSAQYLIERAPITGARVIVAIRDPIARSLSLCFHACAPLLRDRSRDDALALLDRTYRESFWLWVDASPWEVPAFIGHPYFTGTQPSWYDRELRDGLGIDLTVAKPDRTPGFSVLTSGSIELLLIKTARLHSALSPALGSLLGIELADVPIENRREDPLYEMFVGKTRILADTLDYLLHQPINLALFDDGERSEIRERWVR